MSMENLPTPPYRDVWTEEVYSTSASKPGVYHSQHREPWNHAPRGREWRKCIYGEVGTFASEDQAKASKTGTWPLFIDTTARIGITGWRWRRRTLDELVCVPLSRCFSTQALPFAFVTTSV